MEDEEGTFACPLNDCGMKFENENNLEAHKKKHDLSLSLTPTPTFKSSLFDHTPTPTRFLKDLDSELFQELHDNPFDATFRRANSFASISGHMPVPEPSNLLFSNTPDTEPLNTPSIMLTNDHDVALGTRQQTSVILRKKSQKKAEDEPQSVNENSHTLPFSPVNHLSPESMGATSNKVPIDGAHREEEDPPAAQSHSLMSSSSSPVVQDSLVTSAGCDTLKERTSETVAYSTVVQTPVITSIGNLAKTTVTCVPTAVVVTRCTTGDVPSLSSSVSQMSVATEPPKPLVTDQPLLQGIAVAPVVQLIIRLPDGQSMPVKIPVVTLAQTAVTSTAATVVTSTGAKTNTTQSFVKKKLKEVLSVPQRNNQSNNNNNVVTNSPNHKLPVPAATHIISPSYGFDNSLSESPPSSPHSISFSGGRRRRREVLEDPETKRKKSLERNRAAATRCRQKRKQWIQTLEKKADELNETNKLLQNEVAMLRNEVATLKTMLLAHKDCPVTQQQKACGFSQISIAPTSVQLCSVQPSSSSEQPSVNGVSETSVVEFMDAESSSSQSSGVSVRGHYVIGTVNDKVSP